MNDNIAFLPWPDTGPRFDRCGPPLEYRIVRTDIDVDDSTYGGRWDGYIELDLITMQWRVGYWRVGTKFMSSTWDTFGYTESFQEAVVMGINVVRLNVGGNA